MIQEMHERLKKANERRNCGADDELSRLRAALAAKDAEIERLKKDANPLLREPMPVWCIASDAAERRYQNRYIAFEPYC